MGISRVRGQRAARAAPRATVSWGATCSISTVCCDGSSICRKEVG